MPGYPLPVPLFQAIHNSRVVAAGKVYVLDPTTDDPLDTFSDADLTVTNPHPVLLDAQGRAAIYVPAGVIYKIAVHDANDALIYTQPEVQVPAVPAAPAALTHLVGSYMMHATATPKAGWALCDGAAVPRTGGTYDALFAEIGTTFGPGNGTTTFNLPNAKGRFPLFKADASTGSVVGQTGGSLDHTHTGPSHTHTMPDHTHNVPGHTHSVPRDGWTSAESSPPVSGRLQAGGSGVGLEAVASQSTVDNTTGASSALTTTAATGLVTGASGTGATSANNPAFLVVGFLFIKL
jgi:microcystin-dependent protein